MAQAAVQPMTLAEFLAWETRQETRHEFVDGRIIAMAGGTDRHDEVRGNIFAALHGQMRGRPCRFRIDLKLICPNGRSRYPDLAVDCAAPNPERTQLGEPVVVVELLSPSTRGTDYVAKAIDYGSVRSVTAYLIVDPEEARIDVLRRGEDGQGGPDARLELAEQHVGRASIIALPEIEAALALAEIYPPEAEPDPDDV